MMDLSLEEVTIISELSIGVAMAVTQSVWALMVPRRTSDSCAILSGRWRPAENGVEKIVEDEDDSENIKDSILNKDIKNQEAEDGKKRKRPSLVIENKDSVKEENGVGTKLNSNDLIKSVGFRRSRRKNKPRRAAEVGVECR